LRGYRVNRKEAIVLLAELGSRELVNPDLVVLEKRSTENYQLKIKGVYSLKEIEVHLKNRFRIEESKNCLIIYQP
jgi:hypothetical protein